MEKMDYQVLRDEEVVELSAEGDKAATEYILTKYKNFVRAQAKAYFIAGADRDDLMQEGMIGLFKAVRDFDPSKQASFRTFAELCVKRQIITAVKAAGRQKHMPLNAYVSLNKPLYAEEGERGLEEVLPQGEAADPESLFLRQEKARTLQAEIEKKLSKLEKKVLGLYLEGLNYQEIARTLERSPKSIDNALQRVKRKLTEQNGKENLE